MMFSVPNELVVPGYQLVRKLGKGWYSDVYLMHHEALAVDRAVKVIQKYRIDDPNDFHVEAQTLQTLRHPNIVSVHDAGITDDIVFLAMEYIPDGSLASIYDSNPMPTTRALSYISDVSYGLEHAHNNKFVHRDIKPGNILLGSNGHALLSDFGLSSKLSDAGQTTGSGYPAHRAPEMISGGICTELSDIYGLGLSLYRLVNGDAFLQNFGDMLEEKIVSGKFPDRTKYQPFVPRSLRTVINRALNVSANDRQKDVGTFRHELQNCKIYCDWQIISQDADYVADINGTTIRVCLWHDGKKSCYCVELTKQSPGGAARRITDDCKEFSSHQDAITHMYAVINRFVSKGS